MIKTENLVILFTDIAGFTEATSLHSREQNQRILDTHNAILLPIVKKFRGRHIKSIGDALLLVFTSPTDAMRCAMAMQDALHAYNRTAPAGEEIHIRVAASLGEVRVSKGDIFGEPVNVTSRIEGITPQDEIYFSEAVYLAMNKAEVPAIEVGLKELKGIPKPVKVFAIPRFVNSRLVPDSQLTSEGDPQLTFPFGGMHLSATPVADTWINRFQQASSENLRGRSLMYAACVALVAVVSYTLLHYSDLFSMPSSTASSAKELPAINETPPSTEPPVASPAATGVPAVAPIAASPTSHQPQSEQVVPEKKPGIVNISQAKRAYRQARISKGQYQDIVRRLEDEMDLAIRRAKIDYEQGRISKQAYKNRVRGIKLRFYGE